jgi:hypothetical protein
MSNCSPRDDRPYVEIAPIREVFELTDGRSGFGIAEVLFHSKDWQPGLDILPRAFWEGDACSWREVGERLASSAQEALLAWGKGHATEQQLILLCEVTSLGLLDSRPDRTTPELADLVERYRFLADRIPVATRVPGLRDDGNGLDSELFPRGNHLKPGRSVPRRYLQVLASSEENYRSAGSGRLAPGQRGRCSNEPPDVAGDGQPGVALVVLPRSGAECGQFRKTRCLADAPRVARFSGVRVYPRRLVPEAIDPAHAGIASMADVQRALGRRRRTGSRKPVPPAHDGAAA